MKTLIYILLIAFTTTAYADYSNLPKKPKDYNGKHPANIKRQKELNTSKSKLDAKNNGNVLLSDWMREHGYVGEEK